jgi:citrate/tricarballylate utilization protein
VETYKQFVWPRFFSSIYSRNGSAVALITTAITTIVLLLVIFMHASEMFASRVGEGAFYAVIPYNLMVLPSIVIVLWCLLALLIGIIRFWHKIGEKSISLLCRSLVSATADALSLRYLKGGGHGCAFPDERISHLRRWLHHLVFYGFMLCFAATAVAATYEHVLLRTAPYPFWSIPVMLGTIGGVALLIGAGGLFWFKWQSDQSPSNRCFRGMDLVFSALLFLVSLTGLLLLALRETQAMGLMLAVHLGFVWGLFLTLPYGKFVHAIFRYAALIQNEIEAYYEKKQHE